LGYKFGEAVLHKGGKSTPFSVTFSEPAVGLTAVPLNRGVEFRDTANGNIVKKCDNMFGYFLPNGVRFIAGLGDGGMGLFTIRK
jgi:hypothetical protein